MRKTLMLVALPLATLGVGAVIVIATHQPKKASGSIDADLQSAQAAGLDLAQSQTANKYALSEIAPDSKPEPQKTLKKNPGPKAIRSKTPTVKAEAEPTAAEAAEQNDAITTHAAPTPAPAETPAPVNPTPAPQPVPAPQDEGPILAGGTGVGRTGQTAGSGSGGGWGTVLGSILRGGVIDGDNCDPRGQPGRRAGGTVYGRPPIGNPMSMPRVMTPIGRTAGSRGRGR
jgi:outer membrane biosynthesis protein TonB